MTEYARIENGVVAEFGLPSSGRAADGNYISGFNKLPRATLAQAGWYPIQRTTTPSFDPSEKEAVSDWTFDGSRVIQSWRLIDRKPTDFGEGPVPVLEPTATDKVQALIDILKSKDILTDKEELSIKGLAAPEEDISIDGSSPLDEV